MTVKHATHRGICSLLLHRGQSTGPNLGRNTSRNRKRFSQTAHVGPSHSKRPVITTSPESAKRDRWVEGQSGLCGICSTSGIPSNRLRPSLLAVDSPTIAPARDSGALSRPHRRRIGTLVPKWDGRRGRHRTLCSHRTKTPTQGRFAPLNGAPSLGFIS